MDNKIGPFDLDTVRYIIGPDSQGMTKALSPDFYTELDQDYNGFQGHSLVQRFAFEEDWPGWEMHPAGDEFALLVGGDTDFILWRDGREQVVRVDQPGSYIIVPKGLWHTARPHSATEMLFITPGEGTLNAEQPG